MTLPNLKFTALAALLAFAAAGTNAQTTVAHSAPACVPTSGMAKLIARSSGAATVRVYFSATPATCGEHYIEMRRSDAEQFWAALPIPADTTTAVTYRIEARDAQGNIVGTTPPVTVPVEGGCGASTFTPQEQQVANSNIVGMTDEEQNNRLCGFKCDTVASFISVDGQMLPYDCNVWSPAKKLGVGAGFLGTGLIIGILLTDDDEPEQVSPVRP